MDDTDCRILEKIQSHFPVVPRPYQALGDELELPEAEVFQRVMALRRQGIIRQLGAVINAGSLGYTGTLVALRVPPSRLAEVTEIINAYTGVTHNYLREGYYNLWFTLTCPSDQILKKDLATLLAQCKIAEYLELPPQKVFKIRVVFCLNSRNRKEED